MNAKTCKQCGELKPIEQFRKYYGGRKGHYNTCKLCEKINARHKYLSNKETPCGADLHEMSKIEELYHMQRMAGLRPPRIGAEKEKPIVVGIEEMIAKYKKESDTAPITAGSEPAPAELQLWLRCELTEEPDYYLDEVYEELKSTYRPQLRIDPTTLQPVYDDRHKAVLDQILDRFYSYEEDYWNKE